MSTITKIQALTKTYAKRHNALTDLVRQLDAEVRKVKGGFNTRIVNLIAETSQAQAELGAALQEGKSLFEKPRTQTFDGVKVGFQKAKGKIAIPDEGKTIALILKHFPEKADILIRSIESPVKDAIDQLAVADLKKIGCTVKDASDQMVISPAKSDVDKLVTALLRDSAGEE